jgi:hypothetical protein
MIRTQHFAVLLLVGGVVLGGYGALVGDQGDYYIDVNEPVNESEINANSKVVEYGNLSSYVQEAFGQSIESNEAVKISNNPDWDSIVVVHYKDNYYPVFVIVGDANQTTLFFSLLGGAILFLSGAILWYYSSRKKPEDPEP